MNFKSKFSLLAILCIIAMGLMSCKDDEKVDDGEIFATLEDVGLTQTINGGKSFNLTDKGGELAYSTEMSIAAKSIDWTNPVFKQTFNELEVIDKDKITVTNSKGVKVDSVDIKITDTEVKITFKQDNTLSYMSGEKFKLNIVTKLKDGITAEELETIKQKGISTQSLFGINSNETKLVKSNLVSVLFGGEVGFNEKGDPRNSEYKYKLNVVYFVPSDLKENPLYQE